MPVPHRPVFLGVDTGGTYTDAVVYDEDRRRVLGKAKAPTDHDDLAAGVRSAIEAVIDDSQVDPAQIAMVALSTTLATNALVEGRGRPAGLVMIGFEPEAARRGGLDAVRGSDPLIVVGGGHTPHGTPAAPLDRRALEQCLDDVVGQVEAFAVTAQFSVRNPAHEQEARDLIRSRTGLPVTCSHELADALNGPKRSVTALLNARLIALIDELMRTTDAVLNERGIVAPTMVVRGNGSLVSAAFVRERPVETILSGPAASLIGAAHLVGGTDALIADMGGTTTDIAVLRDGLPEFGDGGAVVGGHETMVEAVRMFTHGIGGDSEVRVGEGVDGPTVGPRRVTPLVAAAHQDRIVAVLRRQLHADVAPGETAARFVEPTARSAGAADGADRELLDRIGDFSAVDEVVAGSRAARALDRLVARGEVRLIGFTPTDACHVLGTQRTHDPAAARLGADVLARRLDRRGNRVAGSPEQMATAVVQQVVRRAGEAALGAAFAHDGLPDQAIASPVVAAALDATCRTARLEAGLAVPLIGLGAPAATYYPQVAELLGATVEIPDHADVANAIGAAVGKVRLHRRVAVTAPRRGVYRVHTGAEPETVHDLDEARERATAWLRAQVQSQMEAAGAPDFELDANWSATTVEVEGRALFIEGEVSITAVGPPRLD